MVVRSVSVAILVVVVVGFPSPALAHEEEKGIPAVTDVQEAIAIIASQPELVDHAADKVNDALESTNTRGVNLALVRQARSALQAGRLSQAEVLLERSIGACPGAPVIDPGTAPRTPPPLASPCPSTVPHFRALSRSPVGGTQEPVLLVGAGVVILAGLALARRIR